MTERSNHATKGRTTRDELPLGSHLTSPRRGYLHHGIYAGDGWVIHYAGYNWILRRGRIEEVPLERFTRGRTLQVKAWAAPNFSGPAVIERARTRLGENLYSVWSNNCEHFAQWCIFGASHSAQVEAWAQRLRRVLGLLGLFDAVARMALPSAV